MSELLCASGVGCSYELYVFLYKYFVAA